MAKKETHEAYVPVFSKAALMSSERFKHDVDVLEAILDSNVEYTIAEAETRINEFLNKEV